MTSAVPVKKELSGWIKAAQKGIERTDSQAELHYLIAKAQTSGDSGGWVTDEDNAGAISCSGPGRTANPRRPTGPAVLGACKKRSRARSCTPVRGLGRGGGVAPSPKDNSVAAAAETSVGEKVTKTSGDDSSGEDISGVAPDGVDKLEADGV